MSSIRKAVAWNLISSPFRIATGLLQTAVIARVLTLNGNKTDLGTYAVLAACAGTLVFATNFGMPQVFSRVIADLAQRKEYALVRRFLSATIMLRCIIWSAVALTGLLIALAYSYLWRANPIHMYGSWLVILIAALWTTAMDIAGYGNRALSALYEQKWQNAIVILTQSAGAAIIASGFFLPDSSLFLAVAGTTCALVARAVLFFVAFKKLTPVTPASGQAVPMFRLWRQELRQTGWTGAEKLTQYFQTPAFVLLVIGYLAGREAIGIAFLILDLGAKLIAGISTAISGLVLPAMSRATAEDRLQPAYTVMVIFQSSFGGLLMAGAGAFGSMILVLLYGESFPASPGLIGFVLGAIVFEFMMLDLTGNVLLVQKRIQRMIIFKLVSVATSLISMYVVSRQGGQLPGMLTVLFLIRVLFACAAPNLCDLEQQWQVRQLGALMVILLLAPTLAQATSGLQFSTGVNVFLNLAGFIGIVTISHRVLLWDETRFMIRNLIKKPHENNI